MNILKLIKENEIEYTCDFAADLKVGISFSKNDFKRTNIRKLAYRSIKNSWNLFIKCNSNIEIFKQAIKDPTYLGLKKLGIEI